MRTGPSRRNPSPSLRAGAPETGRVARELRRLMIGPDRLAGTGDPPAVVLGASESHYLSRVLRCRPGDRLAVIDGCGSLWTATLERPDRLRLDQPLEHPLERVLRLRPQLCLALAVPRREPELVWRMATELGVDRLQPLLGERTVLQGRLPVERWQRVVAEATEQCERLWLPELVEPQNAQRWLAQSPPGVGYIATTRQADLPLLAQRLAEIGRSPAGEWPLQLSLAIGPEGGWTPQELALAREAGWQAVSLGPSILRTATAAVAGAAELVSWRTISRASPSPSR